MENYAMQFSGNTERPFLLIPITDPAEDHECWLEGPWACLEDAQEAIEVRWVV